MDTDKIKAGLRRKRAVEKPKLFLKSGSTLLDLACSGSLEGAFLAGHYFFFVGDSDSGKTFLGLTCLAEASINSDFDNYRLIYDAPEGGALMDIERFFGRRVAERLEPPRRGAGGAPIHSRTAEDMYFNLDDALEKGQPFIYIEDSQDALTSTAELGKFDERKKARGKKKQPAGSYGDSKAKVHSANIRRVLGPLKESGSILLILNQTRDSFDMFERSTYSGGRALKFYASLQLWSSVKTRIQRTYAGKKRQLGTMCKVRVVKNRIVGRDRTVLVPIYHSHGVADVDGCVEYLIDEQRWERNSSGIVTATGLGPAFEAKQEKVIRWIEAEGMEDDLKELVNDVWQGVEKACEIKRRKRYD